MSSIDQPFSVLDELVLAAMEVRHDPYDYAFVDQASCRLSTKERGPGGRAGHSPSRHLWHPQPALRPEIRRRCSKTCLNPRFRRIVEQKFGVDLSQALSHPGHDGKHHRPLQRGLRPPRLQAQDLHRAARLHPRISLRARSASHSAQQRPRRLRLRIYAGIRQDVPVPRFPTNPGTASCRRRASA